MDTKTVGIRPVDMATFTCPDCGHDQFHLDSHGRDDDDLLRVHHATCTQCGRHVLPTDAR